MVLLAIGAAHLFLLFNGDILVEYAVVGMVVLPFLFGPRWLALLVAVASLVLFLTMPVQLPSRFWIGERIAQATMAYADGGFLDVLAFRIREIPAIFPLHVLIFPRTIALFVRCPRVALRDFAARFGTQKPSVWHRNGWAVVRRCAHRRGAMARFIRLAVAGRAHEVADRLGGIILAAGYAASIVGLASVPAGQRMLAWAAPVGRTAFTNYLGRSLILGWIFYGYGFGLFGKSSVSTAFAIGVAVYAMQAAVSAWWLGRYRYGPVEWLWPWLMCDSWQPMVQT